MLKRINRIDSQSAVQAVYSLPNRTGSLLGAESRAHHQRCARIAEGGPENLRPRSIFGAEHPVVRHHADNLAAVLLIRLEQPLSDRVLAPEKFTRERLVHDAKAIATFRARESSLGGCEIGVGQRAALHDGQPQ